MNWTGTKIILIVLFLTVSSLLFKTYILPIVGTDSIDEQVIANTVAVLSTHGIYVDMDTIPTQKYSAYELNMKNAALSKDNLMNRLLGKDYETVSENEYRIDTAAVRINGSKIFYQCNRGTESFDGKIVSKKIISSCEHHLKKLGFDKDSYFMYNMHLENGILAFEIMPGLRSYKVEGVCLKVRADRAGILDMEGTWFYINTEKASSNDKFCDVTSVLLEFMYSVNNSEKTINRIEACYYIPDKYINAESVKPIPVYIILCTDGSITVFNAKNASLILQTSSKE